MPMLFLIQSNNKPNAGPSSSNTGGYFFMAKSRNLSHRKQHLNVSGLSQIPEYLIYNDLAVIVFLHSQQICVLRALVSLLRQTLGNSQVILTPSFQHPHSSFDTRNPYFGGLLRWASISYNTVCLH